jgi:hypothetical protein
LGDESALQAAVPGARAGISLTGLRVCGAEGRVPEVGAEAALLGSECCHLTGEVLDFLLECDAVEGWCNTSEPRLGCDLGDVASKLHSG